MRFSCTVNWLDLARDFRRSRSRSFFRMTALPARRERRGVGPRRVARPP